MKFFKSTTAPFCIVLMFVALVGSVVASAGSVNKDDPAARPPLTQEELDEMEVGVLFKDRGAEEVYAYCAACHSERIVSQQGLTRDGWVELFEWMVDEQDMEEIEEPDLTLVLNYLEKNYGPDRPNFPGKKK